MPAPEQIVFPAVQVLGIEHVDPRTDDLVLFDGPNVVPEQVGPDTPDQRDALELVVGGERREFPDCRPGTGGIVRSGSRKLIQQRAIASVLPVPVGITMVAGASRKVHRTEGHDAGCGQRH